MTKTSVWMAALLMGFGVSHISFAQNEQPASAPAAQTALAGEAQSVIANAAPVHLKAKIVGIDRGARIVTLRGPRGNDIDIGLSEQVSNFD
ncbi:hypothetical protein [Paraburkholderia sp. J69-1]|uniref:hypothetical protein n=1 Tax=unclassified Paraburkholderia TaxID=2615204 RepID=UPI0039F06456